MLLPITLTSICFRRKCIMKKEYPVATTPEEKREVETTKDGFVITRDSDGTEMVFNDETGMYEVE